MGGAFGSALPLGLCRQALTHPCAVGAGLRPVDVVDGVILFAGDVVGSVSTSLCGGATSSINTRLILRSGHFIDVYIVRAQRHRVDRLLV